jgi:hypothetical protein
VEETRDGDVGSESGSGVQVISIATVWKWLGRLTAGWRARGSLAERQWLYRPDSSSGHYGPSRWVL